MRLTEYDLRLSDDRLPFLVKEKAVNYPCDRHLDSPEKIFQMMKDVYNTESLPEEYVWLLSMDTAGKLIGTFVLSHGCVNCSIVDPKAIFMRLCLTNASGFVMVHNHVSLETNPSKFDIEITKNLQQCSKIMNINFMDHIIVGKYYYSFMEDGKM